MSCGCGKKKCNGKCGISPSVLQINNNECTLFHKVEIPAVMGDETTNPPKTGAYRNVLLYYEASGNSYLYSSDGIPTKLTGVVSDYEVLTNKPSINGVVLIKNKTLADLGIISAIDSAVADEATARENADNALGDRITANANAIAANATAISNEVTARTNADNTLSARISGNTTAINNEKTARENADTALSNRITANANAISAETTARENADNALSGRITANADAISGEKTARENADAGLQDQITAVKATADSAVQPDDINKTVMSDLAVDSNSSTAQVILKESKVNLKTGATSSEQTSLPVASSSQAGVMNSATYDAVTSNTSNINAIMNGAVAITGLSANPSQSDLTTAWQNETGLSTLINRASVYDVTNNKVWTYYTNDTTWHAASNTSSVTVNTFTNSSEGTIKGSTNIGQVFAENDGTGSVNGWDALSSDVANAKSKLSGIQSGAEVNVQSDWNVSDSSSDAYIKNKPTIGNGTLTIQKNGTTIDTFTANSTTNKTVNITVPTVNDATLTIQKNGDTVQTFTANSSSNKTANIEVPTKTSELDNDAGFIANDTHQVCGEGGNITLNTTTFEPLEMNHLGGNTSQQTYTGKNQLNTFAFAEQGKQATVAVSSDGTFTLTGNQQSNGWCSIDKNGQKLSTFAPNLVVGSTYYLYLQGENMARTNIYLMGSAFAWNAGAAHTITAQDLDSGVVFYGGYNTTSTFKVMITATSDNVYEQYVGGVQAPNPDYPQAVQTVTGENVVRITGKNLFDKNAISTGYLSADGTLSSDAAYRTSDYIAVKPNTAYYKTYTASPRTKYFNSARQPLNTTTYQDISIGGAAGTFTTPANAAYVRFSLPVTGVDLDTTQLELGSTATDYEPYQEQSYEVNLGKNLFDIAGDLTYGGYPISPTNNGDGTLTTTADYSSQRASGQKIKCISGETYTVSGKLVSHTGTGNTSVVEILSGLIGGVTVVKREYIATDGSFSYSFVAPTDVSKLWISFSSVGAGTQAVFGDIQIEKGSQATSYAAYFTPIELCKIGDYQDSIYKSGGKWYVRKEVDRKVLDGSEEWGLAERSGSNNGVFYIDYSKIGTVGVKNNGAFSNYARFISGYVSKVGQFDTHYSQWRFYAPNNTITLNEWKVKLGATPLDLYYLPATPTDTEITNEALVAQLEALWEADGYDSQTNITLTYAEGNAQGILSVCQYPSHLPVATKSKLGTIIVGHGLDIEDDGRLDVIVDSALSESSINPVQNKAITTELNSKADISSVPTKTSQLENDSGFVVNDTTEICDEGSDITLNGTLLEPLDVKKIEGATSQRTYSGKNLINLTGVTSPAGVTGTITDGSTIKVTGTTGTNVTNNKVADLSSIIPAGTYTFTIDHAASHVINFTVNNSDGDVAFRLAPGETSVTKTLTSASTAGQVFWGLLANTTYNETFKLQLVAGSTPDYNFEPYVGGVASPNPEYPQAVQTVTGENVVKINGKNLFDIGASLSSDYFLTYANGTSISSLAVSDRITGSIANNTITIDSYTTTNWTWLSKWVELEKNTDYVLQSVHGQAGVKIIGFNSKDAATAGTQLAYMGANVTTPATFNSGNYKYYAVSIYPVGTGQEVSNTQIEKGSTATAYEPYQGQSYEVNLGKNLYDKDSADYNVYLGSESVAVNAQGNGWSIAIPVEAGQTYTFSKQFTTGQASDANYAFIGSAPAAGVAYIGGRQSLGTGTTFTATAPTGAKYLIIYYTWNATAAQKTDAKATFQIEKGSTATSYANYFTPIELCKIGDYQDSIYKSGDKWYVHKAVGSYTFDGSETWARSGSTTSTVFVAATGIYLGDYIQIKFGTGSQSLFDRFTFSVQQAGAGGRFNLYNGTDYYQSLAISFDIADIPDITAAKAWLTSNTPTLYGVLATPTDTEITNEALVAQLEALWEADGVEGETNIFTVSDGMNERAILSVCQYPSHLPIATKTKLGTIVVGHGLDIEADGKLDVIVDDDFSTESDHPVQNKVITNALAGKADNTDLSTVAMTGSYDDLTGKPTIPTVNNATLTIQKNGTNVATFTANSSTNVTANITAPVVTMTTTDPGEGGALAANNFIGVYV